MPSSTDFDFGTGDYAITARIKGTGTGDYRGIRYRYGGAGGGIAFLTNITNGYLRTRIGGTVLNGTTNVLDNAWHHVLVRRAGAELALFVDGVKQTTASVATENATAGGSIYIGSSNGVGGYPFSGSIDELRVYNRSLSTGEVRELYASAQTLYRTGECNDTTATLHP